MLNVLSTFRGLLLRCDIFVYRSLANCLEVGGSWGTGCRLDLFRISKEELVKVRRLVVVESQDPLSRTITKI